jgi:hypothetical protein
VTDVIVMRHPTLPDHQEIEVPRDAMPHYTPAGWQLVPQQELDERAARAKAEGGSLAAEPRKQRRRAARAAETADEPEQSEPAESTERPARSRTKTAAKKTEEES